MNERALKNMRRAISLAARKNPGLKTAPRWFAVDTIEVPKGMTAQGVTESLAGVFLGNWRRNCGYRCIAAPDRPGVFYLCCDGYAVAEFLP